MARYGKKTSRSAREVLDMAESFFGPGGEGLALREREACCATFAGAGGHVTINISEEGDRTDVDLETREWDFQVKKFMERL